MKRRLEINWHRDTSGDYAVQLLRYRRYLTDKGFRDSNIDSYVGQVGRYLEFVGTNKPPIESTTQFRQILHEKRLSRSGINNYNFAISKYLEMFGEKISLPFLKRNEELPYYFDDNDDVRNIFDVYTNLKHYAMLQMLSYDCLRVIELCNLDDRDLDSKTLTLHIHAGKGNRDDSLTSEMIY